MQSEEDSVNSEGRQQERYDEEPVAKQNFFVLPNSKNKLRACDRCRLIKTEEQWRDSGRCENCKWSVGQDGYRQQTTTKFEGMVSIIDPSHSWVRRRLMLNKGGVSGVYAVQIL